MTQNEQAPDGATTTPTTLHAGSALLSDAAIAAIVAAIQRPKFDPEVSRAILRKLSAPFQPGKVRWKPGITKGQEAGNARALAFIDSRDAENRLDDVLALGWSNSFRELRGGKIIICRIEIHLPDGRVVARENGSDDSDIEPEKGALSGALRRAATMFGVGRYLYGFPRPKVRLNGKFIADDQIPTLRREEQKVWDAWLASEEKRKAHAAGRTSVQVPHGAPASTPPAEPSAPKAAASQPQQAAREEPEDADRVSPNLELRATIERLEAAANADEVQAIARPLFKRWPQGSVEDTAFRSALESAMQRFVSGWTIAGAVAQAKEKAASEAHGEAPAAARPPNGQATKAATTKPTQAKKAAQGTP